MRRSVLALVLALGLTACDRAVTPASGPSPQSAPVLVPAAAAEPASVPETIGQLRRQVSFPVLVPTLVPAGLHAATPSQKSWPIIHFPYVSADGKQGLSVANGPTGSGLDADSRKTGKSIPIRENITAHFLVNQPEFGGSILWWNESGAYVAIAGPYLTEEDLVRIANSMSPDAVPPSRAQDGAVSRDGEEGIPQPTPERYVFRTFKGESTSRTEAWIVLTALPALNWSTYSKQSGGRTMELLQWLDDRPVHDATERANILKATTGLDGAYLEKYSIVLGTLLSEDPAGFAATLATLPVDKADRVISLVRYYASYEGRDMSPARDRLAGLLASSDLSEQEKDLIGRLLEALQPKT